MNKCDTCKYAKWEWSESMSRFIVLDCKQYCYDKMAIGGEDCKHYELRENEYTDDYYKGAQEEY